MKIKIRLWTSFTGDEAVTTSASRSLRREVRKILDFQSDLRQYQGVDQEEEEERLSNQEEQGWAAGKRGDKHNSSVEVVKSHKRRAKTL